jgi:hypothetical protein
VNKATAVITTTRITRSKRVGMSENTEKPNCNDVKSANDVAKETGEDGNAEIK